MPLRDDALLVMQGLDSLSVSIKKGCDELGKKDLEMKISNEQSKIQSIQVEWGVLAYDVVVANDSASIQTLMAQFKPRIDECEAKIHGFQVKLGIAAPRIEAAQGEGCVPPPAYEEAPVAPSLTIGQLNGESFQINLGGVATVADVKAKIQEQRGVAPGQQNLVCNGKVALPEEAVDVLLANPVKLMIIAPAPLLIKLLTGEAFEVPLDGVATVGDVKAQIQLIRGIPAEQQNLVCNGKSPGLSEPMSVLLDHPITLLLRA